ncbi:unnamed protein product, partial [Ceratitis capitata]
MNGQTWAFFDTLGYSYSMLLGMSRHSVEYLRESVIGFQSKEIKSNKIDDCTISNIRLSSRKF